MTTATAHLMNIPDQCCKLIHTESGTCISYNLFINFSVSLQYRASGVKLVMKLVMNLVMNLNNTMDSKPIDFVAVKVRFSPLLQNLLYN